MLPRLLLTSLLLISAQTNAGICTREYAPVCGQLPQQTQTFANRCLMKDAGAIWVSDGECPPAHVSAPVKNITITVAPQDEACMSEGAMRCLRVKMGKDTAWSNFYGPIEGFTFTPGVQYKLLVRASPVANPPADGSNTHFALVRVLWRKPAQ